MHTIQAQDVNDALYKGITHLLQSGVEEESRNGPVLVAPGPVSVEYVNPRARVLYSATRDANCFFHFFENLWFLAGDNDIEFPCYFNSTYGQYSDDGTTMWDAYGWRWRRFFGFDQLEETVTELRRAPASRRCVLTMWNGAEWTAGNGPDPSWSRPSGVWLQSDLLVALDGGKAIPCNTHAYVSVRSGKLDLMVCNRSNDLLFGLAGANAVHMSFLQEYLAVRVGVPVGTYHQVTNNLHAYLAKFPRAKLEQIAHESDTLGALPPPGPAITEGFDEDLNVFMPWTRRLIRVEEDDHSSDALRTPFFTDVALPMFDAWWFRKQKQPNAALDCAEKIAAPDWQRACREWLLRRKK